MRSNERVGVAVLAATVGAAVSTAIAGKGWRPRPPRRAPLELVATSETRRAIVVDPLHGPIIEADVDPSDQGDAVTNATAAVTDAPSVTAAPSVAAATVAETPAGPRMIAVSSIANAVSFMAVGALLTVLVMWATGVFAPSESTAVAAVVREPLPLTTMPAAPTAPRDDVPVEEPEAVAQAPAAPAQVADPQRVQIPSIGVDATIIPLGIDTTGALEVPQDFAQAGWWTGGPEPGEQGASVVVGHVDSFQGPAVFFSLQDLAYDDQVVVTRGDGSSAVFAIRSAVAVDKDAFPTDLVYGETDERILRLITCDGDFTDGSYLGNLIVTAELVEETAAPESGITY